MLTDSGWIGLRVNLTQISSVQPVALNIDPSPFFTQV